MPDHTTRYTVVSPLRFARKLHQPGEELTLSPQQAAFLFAAGKVRPAEDQAPKTTRKKKEDV
ncbi:MAG: hypothetical protein ACK4IT_08010 [Thioalkalivibrionaceae bacterium]